MRIIVDGYNVLKKIYHNQFIVENERKQFLNQIDFYSKKKGHKVLVVFDGGVLGYPEKIMHRAVTVVYSGVNQTADEYIIKFLSESKGERLLVSSDQELVSQAYDYDVPAIDSLLFYNFVQDAISAVQERKLYTNVQVKKISTEENPELDNLMFEAGLVIKPKVEDNQKIKHTTEKISKMTKMENKLYAILKKL